MTDRTALTIADVAQVLQVSEKTISRMLQDDALPGFKVANQWRIHPDDFDSWLRSKRRGRDSAARDGIARMLSRDVRALPLSRLTDEDLIVTDLPSGTREQTLRRMCEPLLRRGIITDADAYVSGLLRREEMMSTGIGGGIALPHLRHPEHLPVERPVVVIGIAPEGLDWDAIDGAPVNVIFLPVTGNEVVHLHTLSSIRSTLIVDGLIDSFTGATTPGDVIRFLLRIETIQQFPE